MINNPPLIFIPRYKLSCFLIIKLHKNNTRDKFFIQTILHCLQYKTKCVREAIKHTAGVRAGPVREHTDILWTVHATSGTEALYSDPPGLFCYTESICEAFIGHSVTLLRSNIQTCKPDTRHSYCALHFFFYAVNFNTTKSKSV